MRLELIFARVRIQAKDKARWAVNRIEWIEVETLSHSRMAIRLLNHSWVTRLIAEWNSPVRFHARHFAILLSEYLWTSLNIAISLWILPYLSLHISLSPKIPHFHWTSMNIAMFLCISLKFDEIGCNRLFNFGMVNMHWTLGSEALPLISSTSKQWLAIVGGPKNWLFLIILS